jgi:hypothetical protein
LHLNDAFRFTVELLVKLAEEYQVALDLKCQPLPLKGLTRTTTLIFPPPAAAMIKD